MQGFAISPNGCYTELKSVWWHPTDVVCCDSNEPLRAAQPQSKAVARQMVRSEAELAKHGLTKATVFAGTDRRLQTGHGKAVEAKIGLELHIKTLGRKLTVLNSFLTCSSRTYIDFINQIVQPVIGLQACSVLSNNSPYNLRMTSTGQSRGPILLCSTRCSSSSAPCCV